MKNESVELKQLALAARRASLRLADADPAMKNRALLEMARLLRDRTGAILAANQSDMERGRAGKLSAALLDRLLLTEDRLATLAKGIEEIAALPDPVGEISPLTKRPNGLLVGRMRIPLGVILMIYEARPGVAADAAALCLKAGNAVILRGGSDAADSNRMFGDVLRSALDETGLPVDAVTVVDRGGHESIAELLRFDEEIDLVIPRGGEGLIRFVAEHSRIPVLKHYKGVCHLFVDRDADPQMAVDLALNGKVQRPGVCNAVETILFHEDCAPELLPLVCRELADHGVRIRGDARTRQLYPPAEAATEADWPAEYLDLIVAVRVVPDLDEAIAHIRKYGSNHTEAIVTEHYESAMKFLRRVGSSTVLINASTRFADGQQLGLGAEIGISTTKLHAYGPMGLEGLTTQKFIVFGDGQVRE
ncbi:MAG: glutamate-5-semialdehyde dehydrogenase [Myxococcales bacterium]|nr:glutamate-5-semialdehyde dehydrogenase [Myxococcales bacterium]